MTFFIFYDKIQLMNLNIPINSVSFGQVSYNILKELKERGETPALFPIGNIDISSFNPDKDMQEYISLA